MGAWGIEALERDEGLDVLDLIADHYLPDHKDMKLEELIALLQKEDFLGEKFEDIDFFYDNSAMALAELYLDFLNNGKLSLEDDIWSEVQSFTATPEAIQFLMRYLEDILQEVPDVDGKREIVELWKNSEDAAVWSAWQDHVSGIWNRLRTL